MAIYRIFLRTDDELADMSTEAVCANDREARELVQRMLDDGNSKDGRAEVWTGTRFVGIVTSIHWLIGC